MDASREETTPVTPADAERHRAHELWIRITPGVFVLLWSTGFIGAKFGLPYAEPLTFLFIRFGILVALLVPFAFVTRAPWPESWSLAGHVAVTGALVHGGYLGGVFVAISLGVSAGLAALIVGLQPLLTAVVVGPLLGERVSLRQWLGLVLGLGGVVLVVAEKMAGTGIGFDALGIVFAVGALFSITFGTVYQKRFCGGMDLRTGTAIQYMAATVVMGTLAPLFETMEVAWTGEFVFALFWLVFVLSVGAISLLMLMIRRGEVARVASFFYMVPPVTALIAWGMFGERLGVVALAGMALAVIGVALVVSRR